MVKKLLFLIVIVCLAMACNKPLSDPLPLKVNDNLKFFGFTLIDVSWDDPTDDSETTNFIDEVKDFSNLADILVVNPSDNIISRLERMANVNVKAVLHLNELFFENTGAGGTTSGFIYQLRADYQDRWDEFISVNSMALNYTMVGAFYIGEEPLWNGISEADFTLAADYAKQSIPQVPILLVEAFAVVNEMYVPASVNWVGFDHYFLKTPSENSVFLSELAAMKSKMNEDQKVCLVMDTHWIKIAHGSSGISKTDMDVIARDYYNMANADTLVVAILGYYWPNGFEFKGALGARGLPSNVQLEYQNIGKSITGK